MVTSKVNPSDTPTLGLGRNSSSAPNRIKKKSRTFSELVTGAPAAAEDPVEAEEREQAATSRRDTATAKVFGKRPYGELSWFERRRVGAAELFETRVVDMTIIMLVLVYTLFIFAGLSLETDDCTEVETVEEFLSNVVLVYVDLVFLSLFLVEIIVKVFAFGHKYLFNFVNLFDTTIVVVSFFFTVFSLTSDGTSNVIVRVLRLGRIIRVLLIMNKLNKSREGLTKLKYASLESGVEAPVYKVLSLLQELAARLDNQSDKRNLAWIVDVIGSDRLYHAVVNTGLTGENLDSETAEWLNSQYHIKEKAVEEAEASRESGPRRTSLAAQAKHDDDDHVHGAKTYGIRTLSAPQRKQLDEMLSHVDGWEFDVFKLFDVSGGMPLVPLVLTIFERHNMFDRFRILPTDLAKVMSKIQAGYAAVPYHNRIHAADVTQTLYSLVLGDAVSQHVNEIELFAAILAAACHDYGHPGLNNLFHVKNKLEVAMLYNDAAVLENMHISRAWAVLTSPEHDLFKGLQPDEFSKVRDLLITMVLGTDMSGHFDELARFMTKTSSNGFETQSVENTKMILKMALHCSDVSNPAKGADLCIPWAVRVMNEFFMQGDKEKEVGNNVSPFMDRETTQISKCQGGFIKIIVTPLYEAWQAFAKSDTGGTAVECCKMNQEAWSNGGEDRIERWLEEKTMTLEHKMLTDHGVEVDELCSLPAIMPGQEKFYYPAVVKMREAAAANAASLVKGMNELHEGTHSRIEVESSGSMKKAGSRASNV